MRAKAFVLYEVPPNYPSEVDAGHSSRWSPGVVIAMLLRWHERARQRRALSALDDRMLEDIRVSRADAEREANKPFWRS